MKFTNVATSFMSTQKKLHIFIVTYFITHSVNSIIASWPIFNGSMTTLTSAYQKKIKTKITRYDQIDESEDSPHIHDKVTTIVQ